MASPVCERIARCARSIRRRHEETLLPILRDVLQLKPIEEFCRSAHGRRARTPNLRGEASIGTARDDDEAEERDEAAFIFRQSFENWAGN